ncbi:MAG: ABC transporter permease [Lachnospiraceae bacterium]|jgi:putative ABC transport system permease protein|nr:ABC transporter permease [Lachnospiraceae bacterium]
MLINAFKSISRSKGRNILIGIIVITIAIASAVSLSIKQAANKAKTEGLNNQEITGTIGLDREKLMSEANSSSSSSSSSSSDTPDRSGMRELMEKYPDLTLTQLKKYADSDYVKSFLYTGTTSLDATGDIEAYSTSSSSDDSSNSSSSSKSTDSNAPTMPGMDNNAGGGRAGNMMSMGDFSVVGYSSEKAMTDFVSGTSKISDGEVFDTTSDEYNCVISSELATFNSLKVGSYITLANPSKTTETYKFKIVGIYTTESTDTSSNEPQMNFGTANDAANKILISYPALEKINSYSTSKATTSTDDSGNETTTALRVQTNGTYVFANKTNYDKFAKELTSKGLSKYYSLSSSDVTNYENSLVPLNNLSKFANTMLWIVLAVGGVILVVLNIFNIRERKYEVGVLTAIGVKKWKVAMQFVCELLAVTLVSIIIGAGIGAAVSVPVSNKLLASQVEQTQTTTSNTEQNFGRGGDNGNAPSGAPSAPGGQGGQTGIGQFTGGANNATEYISNIKATMNIGILGKLIAIGIALTIISSLAGVIFVLRYEPLKILSERS